MKGSQKQQQEISTKLRKTQLKNQKIRRKLYSQDYYYKDFEHNLKNYKQQSIQSSERGVRSKQQDKVGVAIRSNSKREKRQNYERKSYLTEHIIETPKASSPQPGQEILVTLDNKKIEKWWEKIQARYFKNFQPKDTLQGLKQIIFQRRSYERQKTEQKDRQGLLKSSLKNERSFEEANSNNSHQNSFEIGSGSLSQLKSYFKEVVSKDFPQIEKNDNLRVLFKDSQNGQNHKLVIFQLNRQQKNARKKQRQLQRIKSDEQKNNQLKNVQQARYRVRPYRTLDSNKNKVEEIQQPGSEKLQDLPVQNMQIITIVEDKQIIKKMQTYQNQVQKKGDFVRQIDFQLHLWDLEYSSIERRNNRNWQNLQKTIQRTITEQQKVYKKKSIPKTVQETTILVDKITNSLTWCTILRSFEQGFHEKTQKMVESYKENLAQTRAQNQRSLTNKIPKKKWQDTDCKICFCGLNSDSNQIIYCDQCNTSFHRACYGLREIPKEEYYYCDSCVLKKREISHQSTSSNGNQPTMKISCQICQKANFPIKNLNGHYYHVTCLMLFNYITFLDNRFVFREGVSHQKIQQNAINNQIQNYSYCQYCVSHGSGSHANGSSFLGMKLQCSFQNCSSSYHPICAYLSGCLFNVKKTGFKKDRSEDSFLEVKIFCNHHAKLMTAQRDFKHQAYFRRFLCNFRDSCEKNLNEFVSNFKEEQERLQKSKALIEQSMRRTLFDKILHQTKSIKKYILSKQQNLMKKQKGKEEIETETGKLLEKLKKKSEKISIHK